MVTQPRAYEANGAEVDARQFIGLACDPRRSVVVEACAGSGKTWLLVARMLRLLLAGAEPAELLAITFTRKAAQEMRERLLQLLQELALQPEPQACALLTERGIAEQDLPRLLPVARGLYHRVLSSPQGLSLDTFHSWFARLLQLAPLASGVPHGYALAETTGDLRAEAYSRFMESLNHDDRAELREALLALYELAGDWNAKQLLDSFVDKRAEWFASVQRDRNAPLDWLRELCGEDGQRDARLSLWQDEALLARIQNIARLLGQGAKRNQERAVGIESALTAGAGIDSFAQLLGYFRDEKGEPRGNDHRRGKLLAAIEKQLGADGADAFEREFIAVGDALLRLQRRSYERHVLLLNEVLFIVGQAYLDQYQAVKAERRVFDFGDLEWHAYRLLSEPEHAAYLHSRLDARYRHILLDEFQDTNPLQWSIVRAWLRAYGDGDGPSVFVVGDPKQSIYRFRRAEPRVFDAARDLLTARSADVLRTNQTRRNAGAIIELLNASLRANPIFSPQTTLSTQQGSAWRLPLIRSERARQPAAAEFALRDPLATPREEEEDLRRLEEGRAIARAILQARRLPGADGAGATNWSDVMLLVKKRTHLGVYETALREAGIPFVSDRRGGLLQSLEVADLIALLSFLITPGDNRALAHVLKSPLFGAADDDLIALAERAEAGWWPRLRAAAADASPALRRAAALLQDWLDAAPRLPVHDLLDLILHQGDVPARYAQAAPAALRAQTLGNIDAFIELALSLDAGRYPSLPKFIDELQRLRRDAEGDAPGEATVDAAVDAVRILTIHGAKGLEAEIVALADANHSEPARDDCGILCDWPEQEDAPTHFSCFGRQAERGAARDELFAAEEAFRRQEDWNLLYVAATRAKRILIVSGVAGARGADEDGVVEGSWYQRLLTVPPASAEDPSPAGAEAHAEESEFSLPLFRPPRLPSSVAAPPAVNSLAIEEGIALHALLERLTYAPQWPIEVPDAADVARWLHCPLALAATVRERALRILGESRLERFFNPARFVFARNELEVMADGELLRFDRAVVCEDEVWVIDYKRDLLDSERALYAAQLDRYRRAALQVFPGKVLRTALVTADGRLWEIG